MKSQSRWSVRRMECPEGKGRAGLLLEWKGEKGKKVLHGVTCDHPQLARFGGGECRWVCLEKISGRKP